MTVDTCTECGRTIPPAARRYEKGDRVLCYSCASEEAEEEPREDLSAERDERRVERSTYP